MQRHLKIYEEAGEKQGAKKQRCKRKREVMGTPGAEEKHLRMNWKQDAADRENPFCDFSVANRQSGGKKKFAPGEKHTGG